jgi:hypothetical protein
MSNFLAVATVTAALQELLQRAVDADVPGAKVRTDRPDATRAPAEPIVNIYLYHVATNSALRNADLPTRRSDGSLTQRPRAALDMHYLMSFYGTDSDLVPQRLLGSSVSALHAQPVISADLIAAVVAGATASPVPLHPALALTDLADAEPVRLCPHPLDLEELSRVWSIMFQTPYALSISWQASVVLLERSEKTEPVPPVLTPVLSVAPTTPPRIDRVVPTPPGMTVTIASTLEVHGSGFLGDAVTVKVGAAELLPGRLRESVIEVDLTTAPAGALRAGTVPVRIVKRRMVGDPPAARGEIGSSAAPVILRPAVLQASVSAGIVSVTTDVTIGAHQSVDIALVDPVTGVVRHRATIADRPSDGTLVAMSVAGVAAGTYGVIVYVDGAGSEPTRDPAGTITAPLAVLP